MGAEDFPIDFDTVPHKQLGQVLKVIEKVCVSLVLQFSSLAANLNMTLGIPVPLQGQL